MGAPTGLYGSLQAGGFGYKGGATAINHEDLVDVVTILDSYQTPFFSTAPKVRARDVVHSWTIDTLSATALTGSVEGDDFTGNTLTGPIRLFNNTQIFSRSVVVSDRERDANPAGIRDMYEYQVMKEFKVLARNFEASVFSTGASASATGDATTYPKMANLRGTYSGWSIASLNTATLSTASIVSLSQTLYTAGAEPDSIWFSPRDKANFVNATVSSGSGNVRNIAATDQRIVANIDVFETPFNQLYAVIVDRFLPAASSNSDTHGFLIGDRSMAKVAFFRPPQHKPMGKNGDHTRGLILMEPTIELTHPSAWGVVSGVSA